MGRNLFRYYLLILLVTPLWATPLAIKTGGEIFSKKKEERLSLPYKQPLRGELYFDLPFEMNGEIEKYIRFFTSEEKLAYLQRAMGRARPFRSYINGKIEEFALPKEIYYLPVIESAYRYDAVSRSGAVGMWQFMTNSIGPYDMEVNHWLDERRDFWKSTEGALKKLIHNRESTGSWPLALAAYNCGLGRVTRTLASTGENNYWILAENRDLPSETANYVAKFLAVSIICSYGGRWGLERDWEISHTWERIELETPVDLRLLAQESNLDYSLLDLANGELSYSVTPPVESGYKLKIPTSSTDQIRETLNSSENRFMKFYRYNIKSGDTLSQIGEHYSVPISLLNRYNEDLSPKKLRVGQNLIIPALFERSPYREEEEDIRDFNLSYTVQKGDSLWSISGFYDTTPELLASRNKLSLKGTLNIGMKLMVPREKL